MIMILNSKHFAVITLLIVITWIGNVHGRQSRDMRFTNDTQMITYEPSSSSSPKTALSETDDSWFSWRNWRNILLHGGESSAGEARTFGLKRRLQMAIIPLVFKFGVLSTLIFMLVGLGLKTVFLLKILLVLNLAGLVAKFFAWKSELAQKHQVAYSGWATSPIVPYSSGSHNPFTGKEVHLHIHNGGSHSGSHSGESWEPSSYRHDQHIEPYGAYTGAPGSYVHPSQRRSFKKAPMTYSVQQ